MTSSRYVEKEFIEKGLGCKPDRKLQEKISIFHNLVLSSESSMMFFVFGSFILGQKCLLQDVWDFEDFCLWSNIQQLSDDNEDISLTAFEQQNSYLTQVEVDEMTSFMCHVWAKVASNDAMPCWIIFFVEFFLDVCGNVLRKKNEKDMKNVRTKISAEIDNLS